MKPASSAALAIMAAGQMKRIDLYAITLAGGSPTYYLTGHQVPVPFGNQLYQTGYVIKRGALKQAAGLEVQQMQLTLTPNANNSTGVPLIAGFPLLKAAALKIFDNARVLYSKMFLNDFNDLTPGAVPWFQGRVGQVDIDRLSLNLQVNSDIQTLNAQGPPNLIQKGCSHVLFDAGCGLIPSSFQVSGTVTTGSTVLNVNTNLTQPDFYFSLGRIKFISGANATNPSTTYFVKFYQNASGQIQLVRPLPNVPQAGDLFVVLPGCPKTMAACSNTSAAVSPPFNNLKRFRGMPFVPVPETLYDGGTVQRPSPSRGYDGSAAVGSIVNSGFGQQSVYKP